MYCEEAIIPSDPHICYVHDICERRHSGKRFLIWHAFKSSNDKKNPKPLKHEKYFLIYYMGRKARVTLS